MATAVLWKLNVGALREIKIQGILKVFLSFRSVIGYFKLDRRSFSHRLQ